MDKRYFHDFIDFFAVLKYFEFYSFLLKLLMSHSVKPTKNGFLNANHSFLWKIIMMRHFVSQNKEILNHNAMHHFFRQNNRRCTNQNIGNFLQATTLGELWSRLPWHWSLGTGILVTSLEWLVHFTITLLWVILRSFTSWMRWSLGKNGPDWWCQESNANEELLLLTTQRQQPAPKERKRSRVLQTSTHAFIDPVSPYAKNWWNRGRCSLEGATLLLFLLRPLFSRKWNT